MQTHLPPLASNISENSNASQIPHVLHEPSDPILKRKQDQDARHRSPTQDQPPSKRLRAKPSSCTAEKESHPEVTPDISEDNPDPLQYWIQTGKWRKEYFEQDSQVRDDFERGKSSEEPRQRECLQELYTKEPFRPMHAFTHLRHLFARKKSSSFLEREESQSSLQTPSDQLPREVKSAQYRTPAYALELENEGSYMREFDCDNPSKNAGDLCRALLETEQVVPQDSLFRDDLFKRTCQNIEDGNEAMVIRDIGLLIVPSAQTLATYGAKHLNHLTETTNQGWNSVFSFPLHKTRPQPDYSVGFGRSAFTEEQLNKLKPLVGEPGSKAITYFMATTRMYFPFLTCEVNAGLDIADRQNAHSMTVAVRALVQLYKGVKRENELHREILAFSVSHDHSSVRIYGHYAIIEGDKTTFYRHIIHRFDFTALNGRDKWTAYKFTKNVYDKWMPIHHQRICSAIDDLPPDIDFSLSQSASLSQSGPQRSNVESPLMNESDSQSSAVGSQDVAPITSFT